MLIRCGFLILLPLISWATEKTELQNLPGTAPLTLQGDLAAMMVSGIDQYLMREWENCAQKRAALWKGNFGVDIRSSLSVEPKRQRFRTCIGAWNSLDPRVRTTIEIISTHTQPQKWYGKTNEYTIYAIRWTGIDGLVSEGLLLQPKSKPVADVVALPDCDQSPEMLAGIVPGISPEAQFARRLVENGCRVLIPLLIDRRDTYSNLPGERETNLPHREFLYRAAYEMGRHIIGYEVNTVISAVNWLKSTSQGYDFRDYFRSVPVGVIGYGEGGLIAFYSAAAYERIDAAAVCGYFGPREAVWKEPIYRNVWSLLREFGDAEIASLIAPRSLIVDSCPGPEIAGPPQTPNRSGAAPGVITTPAESEVEREILRARDLINVLAPSVFGGPTAMMLEWIRGKSYPGSDETLSAFLKSLKVQNPLVPSGDPPVPSWGRIDQETRFKRQFDQIVNHTQYLMREAEFQRKKFWFKANISSVTAWQETTKSYRDYFWNEVIGRLPTPTVPLNPRTRIIYDEPKYRGYEVMLDVYPDVFAYGIILIPKDIKDGERRPVVVCQHGLEGRPQDVADPKVESPYYHQFACRLAEEGFITYAPQNPYIGGDKFRVLQRKANPLKLSLFSFIVQQHERTLEWLSSLPFVDADRIGFYGLSYGGKTAMRVPALLERYCLSICSGDFNEWIWKNVSVRYNFSYMFTGEYEMPEWNLGNTFNYAEMSGLICPRPFMVERGHNDGVGIDEWVAYEYAKTRRLYDQLGIGDRTQIEFFNGPHTIHGVGTFDFLRKQLHWLIQ